MKVKRGPRVVDIRTTDENRTSLQFIALAAFNEHLKAVNGTIGGHAA